MAKLTYKDLKTINGLGDKSIKEIVSKTKSWIKSNIGFFDCNDNNLLKEVCFKESNVTFSEDTLCDMAHHSIKELGLSMQTYNLLSQAGKSTINKLAILTWNDLSNINGLEIKLIQEIKLKTKIWIKANVECLKHSYDDIDSQIKSKLSIVVKELKPVVDTNWTKIYDIIKCIWTVEEIESIDVSEIVREVFETNDMQTNLKLFWQRIMHESVMNETDLIKYVSTNGTLANARMLIEYAMEKKIICCSENNYMLNRKRYEEAFEELYDSDDRNAQILYFKTDGESLQSIGNAYGMTRERVRQIIEKMLRDFPKLYEDYFCEPYTFFDVSKEQFLRAFPDLSEEGYEYLRIKYRKGKNKFSENTLEKYDGAWKDRLLEFIIEENENADKQAISRLEIVREILIENEDVSLNMEEFESKYYRYIELKELPLQKLKLNMRTISNHLRTAKGIVFDSDSKVRYCNVKPEKIWDNIDVYNYNNSVVSAELIYNDYVEIMNELGIRDGYELFYIIKYSLDDWNGNAKIRCRRVPVIVIGNASEKNQAIRLIKERSPILYTDYFMAYEEKYGIHHDSVKGNSVIMNVIINYYVDGYYIIDVPMIDSRDSDEFVNAINKKDLWFLSEVRSVFNKTCKYSTQDAMNAATFNHIGYMLYSTYILSKKYVNITKHIINETVFSSDVVKLKNVDKKLRNLSTFCSVLDSKKRNLEYIEIAPAVLMSIDRVKEVYGIGSEEIRQIQSLLTPYYNQPFFNGNSIWKEVKSYNLIKLLKGNKWMLTCIMRQQEGIASMRVSGGIILSKNMATLNLVNICKWITSASGKMTINDIVNAINNKFGTTVLKEKVVEKLKTSGKWNEIINQ